MKIADFLEANDLTGSQLSKMLGYTGAEAVNARRRRDEDIPEAWLGQLAELGYAVDGGVVAAPPPLADDGRGQEFREHDAVPQAPPDAPRPPVEVVVDYATVAGYIEGAYKLSAQMVVEPMFDPILADVINAHAEQAGAAWAHWIESEPKVAALIQRLMIGTPLGEVIGVHVAIVFSYTLARGAARELAAAAATHGQAQAPGDGAAEAAPEAAVAGA